MLALLNSEVYRDLAIPQVWARELDEGRFWCSQSSMYRIARGVCGTTPLRATASARKSFATTASSTSATSHPAA